MGLCLCLCFVLFLQCVAQCNFCVFCHLWYHHLFGSLSHLHQIPSAELGFILGVVTQSAVDLCCHPYGCRVVQRVLERCDEAETAPVIKAILPQLPFLVGDQYGNYVLQHILEFGSVESKNPIFSFVQGRVVPLSSHKYASNILERCLQFGTPELRSALIDEIVTPSFNTFVELGRRLPPDPHGTPLQILVASPFGNFVVQRMVDSSNEMQRTALLEMLWSYAPILRRYTYGRHILSRLEKMASSGMPMQ